jgi:hypothetical protein
LTNVALPDVLVDEAGSRFVHDMESRTLADPRRQHVAIAPASSLKPRHGGIGVQVAMSGAGQTLHRLRVPWSSRTCTRR